MMAPETIRREAAVRSCMERFYGKPLKWGVADCVKLTAHSMHRLGVSVPLLKGVQYRSELGAARALKAAGHDNLVDAMDALGLVRIAPAMTWPGDIVAGRSREDGPFSFALSVVHEYGAARTLAFGSGGICGVGSPNLDHPDIVAWRVARG